MRHFDHRKHESSNTSVALHPALKADPVLQDIARAAATAAGTAIGLVTFLDEKTQWIIARFGYEADSAPREAAFCAWAVHNAEVMWIEDALADERFHDNPFVQDEPNVRFYAGAPLSIDEGRRIGTVCVFDPQPRPYDQQIAAQLEILAARACDYLRAHPMVSL